MGTYHPMPSTTRANKKRTYSNRKYSTNAEVAAYLEDMIAHPKTSLAKLDMKHGLGRSTTSNWFYVFDRPNAKPLRNHRVATWLKDFTDGKNNLARLLKARPRQRIAPLILQEVADAVALHDGVEADPTRTPIMQEDGYVEGWWVNKGVGHDRRVGPTGIGTFVPTTTDDLLVVRGEVQAVKDEVLIIASEASKLIDAIDLVRETLNTTDKLQLAMGRIDQYESRIRELEATVDRFRQQKLASNQIHSND